MLPCSRTFRILSGDDFNEYTLVMAFHSHENRSFVSQTNSLLKDKINFPWSQEIYEKYFYGQLIEFDGIVYKLTKVPGFEPI